MKVHQILGTLLVSVALCNAGFGGELLGRMLGLEECGCTCGTCASCNTCVGAKCCCPEPVCCGSACATRCCAKPCCAQPCCEKPCCEPKCHKLYRRPVLEFLENLFCGDDCCCGSSCCGSCGCGSCGCESHGCNGMAPAGAVNGAPATVKPYTVPAPAPDAKPLPPAPTVR